MKENNYEVRKATPEDTVGILAIENETFSSPWSMETVTNTMCDGILSAVIEKDPGKEIVGYIFADMRVDGECELQKIAVKRDYRGMGLSLLLMDTLVSLAKKNGKNVIFLEVRESNARARGLYKKYGFYESGRRKNYYRDPTEDAILMTLEIQQENR